MLFQRERERNHADRHMAYTRFAHWHTLVAYMSDLIGFLSCDPDVKRRITCQSPHTHIALSGISPRVLNLYLQKMGIRSINRHIIKHHMNPMVATSGSNVSKRTNHVWKGKSDYTRKIKKGSGKYRRTHKGTFARMHTHAWALRSVKVH